VASSSADPEPFARQIRLSRELDGDDFVAFKLTEKLAIQFLLGCASV
jgi:hypothetical protein